MKYKFYLTIAVGIFLCSLLMCCGGNSILNKAWNIEIGPPKKVVIVKLEGEVSVDWADSLEAAMSTRACETVIAWIESPGGSVRKVQILQHKIELLKQTYKKELIVYTERWMMSGAYWIACEANKIITSPVAMCGSIGVYFQRVDATKLDSMSGIAVYTFRSGEYKAIGNPHVPMTQSEYNFWLAYIRTTHRTFINQVLGERFHVLDSIYVQRGGDALDTLRVTQALVKIADGRFYSAYQAFDTGLIDHVMWLDQLIAIYKLAGYDVVNLDGTKYEI